MKRLLVMGLLVLFLLVGSLVAGVPQQISFQGYLSTLAHEPVSGQHILTFAIYDAQCGGANLWSDIDTLNVEDGQFHTYLGKNQPLPDSMFTGQILWLETRVDGGLLPERQPLVSVAYSFRSQWADSAGHADMADTALVALSDTSSSGCLWGTNGSDVYRAGGNVGIGTATPMHNLEVSGTSRLGGPISVATTSGIEIAGDDGNILNIASDDGVALEGTSDSSGVMFLTNQAMRMVIDAEGKVGIGTTSPDFSLDVDGITRSSRFSTTTGSLGNGSSSGNLYYDGLLFEGTYGYAVGDQYIQFNSGFSPSVGGQGLLAKITAYRLPEHYDTGIGRLKFSCRSGSGVADVLAMEPNAVTVTGDLCVTGQKNAVVPTSQGMTKVYSEESAEVWFTDYGRGQVIDGRCHIDLPRLFLETVTITQEHPMMVFLQEEGECNGLIVQPGSTGFDVTERGYGLSDAQFSYRIVAKRKEYERSRLETVETSSGDGAR